MEVVLSESFEILIADDDVDFRNSLKGILTSEGYSPYVVQDGAAAIEFLKSDHARILILDIMMPNVSGLEVLRYVKENTPATKVIVLSGYLGANLREECERLGALHMLTKPYDIVELLSILNALQDKATFA